jgi:hypothetical protein
LRQLLNVDYKTGISQQFPSTNMPTADTQQESILKNTLNDQNDLITEFNDKCIIIKMQQRRVFQNNGDVYITVRACWRNSISKAEQGDYILAVIEGIVKEVY